jgi:hypothetical protein
LGKVIGGYKMADLRTGAKMLIYPDHSISLQPQSALISKKVKAFQMTTLTTAQIIKKRDALLFHSFLLDD